jgi:hypothetical protein
VRATLPLSRLRILRAASKWRRQQEAKKGPRPRVYQEPFIEVLEVNRHIKPAKAWEEARALVLANRKRFAMIEEFGVDRILYKIGKHGTGTFKKGKPGTFSRFLYRLRTGR